MNRSLPCYTEKRKAGDSMEMERLEILQESPKSKVYLAYDQENHRMVVEKHLAGNISIYRKLKDLSHSYLPKIYEVYITSEETIVLEEYINGESLKKIRASEKQLTQWIVEHYLKPSNVKRYHHSFFTSNKKRRTLLVGFVLSCIFLNTISRTL